MKLTGNRLSDLHELSNRVKTIQMTKDQYDSIRKQAYVYCAADVNALWLQLGEYRVGKARVEVTK